MNTTINHAAHLSLKLGLWRYFLKQENKTRSRNWLQQNYHRVPLEIFDAVVAECVSEGLFTVSVGPKGGEFLTWHEENIKLMEVLRG
jgi:hypothetical protein